VASGVRDAREIAWIAWTMLLLTIKLGACLDLAGLLCNTLQYPVHIVNSYDSGCARGGGHCSGAPHLAIP
jgi:hypothetical protein